jgi:hypothetical protein
MTSPNNTPKNLHIDACSPPGYYTAAHTVGSTRNSTASVDANETQVYSKLFGGSNWVPDASDAPLTFSQGNLLPIPRHGEQSAVKPRK